MGRTINGTLSGSARGRIAGVVGAVPANIWTNSEIRGAAQTEKMTGVHERRRVWGDQTAETMMVAAARRLLMNLAWDPSSISLLVVVTQTPYRPLPAAAYTVHSHLNLSPACLVMEVNWSCAGYVNGLFTVMRMLDGGQRALLLVADAMTAIIDQTDRATAPLFGDAGSATAIESGSYVHHFSLGSDGEGNTALSRDHGKCLHMDGAEVFNFTLDRVPAMVADVLALRSDPDIILFHQANKFMLDHLIKKANLRERFPDVQIATNIDRFGNCSSVSIPLLMVDQCADKIKAGAQVAAFGFGAGWAWAGAMLDMQDVQHLELMEV